MAQQTIEDFRIDISHEQSFRYLQAKQFDNNSRIRRLIITDNNIPISLTGKELIDLSLYVDGDNYSNTSCPFGDDGHPYVTFTDSMLSRKGDVSCEIRIYDSAQATVATTFTFMMTVSQSLLNQDRLIASSEFNILNDLILQANSIPDLIKEFGLSQAEINTLITKIKADINDYTNQFSTMKTKYTNDFNTLMQKINSDITSYQSEYTTLKSDILSLKSTITTWYTTAQAAENTRIANENKRKTDTATAIKNCETATANTNTAISGANTARDKANEAATKAQTQAAYAQNQGDRVDMALQDFEFRIHTVDGGDLTDTVPVENTYDGGSL